MMILYDEYITCSHVQKEATLQCICGRITAHFTSTGQVNV